MTVYAITETGKRFVMFQTNRLTFAHSNATATAHLYVETVTRYEIDGIIFEV